MYQGSWIKTQPEWQALQTIDDYLGTKSWLQIQRFRLDLIDRLIKRLELKYSDDQPRWPEGQSNGGQWKPKEAGEGESGESGEGFGLAPDGTLIESVGGIPPSSHNLSVQTFMSLYCKGSIREVMPWQYLNMPIADVMRLAQTGDPYARTCMKLLKQNEYRK